MQEDFETGSVGTAITALNTTFTSIDQSAAVATFDSSLAVKNSQSAKILTDAVGGRFAMLYTFGGLTPVVYARWYMNITEFSSQNMTVATVRSSSGVIAQFRINANQTVSLQDGNLATDTSQTTLPQAEWIRCEWAVDTNSGTQEARIFAGDTFNNANINSAIFTLNGTAPVDNLIQSYRVGLAASAVSYEANYDAISLVTSNWPGPDPGINNGSAPGVISEDFESGSVNTELTSNNTIFSLMDNSVAAAEFSSEQAIKNQQSAKVTIGSSAGRSAGEYNFESPESLLHARWYQYVGQLSDANMVTATMRSTNAPLAQVRFNSSGTISLVNGLTAVATSAVSVPLSTWIRLEWRVDTASGQQELRLYSGPNINSVNPSDAYIVLNGAAQSGEAIDYFRFGVVAATTNCTVYYDALQINPGAWPGPDPDAVALSGVASTYSGALINGARRPLTKYGVRVGGVWRPVVAVGHRVDGVWRPAPPLEAPPGGGGDAIPSYSFGSSGLTGGGFQNVIAISPFLNGTGQRPYIMGADVSGIHRSTDRGQTWIRRDAPDHIASLMWSKTTPGLCYAAANQGIYRSTNFGLTWSRRNAPVDFDANGDRFFIAGTEHPRPTGHLLATDESTSTKYLWAAMESQGLRQSIDDGNSWRVTALAGDHLRGLALDPNNPDILYVAVGNYPDKSRNGVWRSTNARSSSMSFTRISGYPGSFNVPEELLAIDDGGTTKLYVAGHQDGIMMYNGSTWTTLNNGIDTGASGAVWLSIAGYRASGGNIVLYVGASRASNRRAIMRSTNGGSSWTAISAAANSTVDYTLYGNDHTSWLSQIQYHNFAGNLQWTAAMLAIDPDHLNRLWISGRGGAWIGIESGGQYTWQPAHNGLMVTVNMSVATDPQLPGRMVIGNMDYTVFSSADNADNVVNLLTDDRLHRTTGDVVVYDAQPAATGQPTRVYLAASRRGTNTGNGGVYSHPDPSAGGEFINENLPVNNDVPNLGVGRDTNGNRIILAGVTQLGLYRKQANTWTQVTGGPFSTGQSGNGCYAWKPNSSIVYAFDDNGIWRSSNAGAQGTWVKILNAVSNYRQLDAMVLDPINHNYLYINDRGLKRIVNAETSQGIGSTTVANISGISSPGPIAINGQGHLFVHDRAGRLMRSLNPRTGSPAFTNIADDFYATVNSNIRSLAVGPDHYIYTAENGNGVSVGIPSF